MERFPAQAPGIFLLSLLFSAFSGLLHIGKGGADKCVHECAGGLNTHWPKGIVGEENGTREAGSYGWLWHWKEILVTFKLSLFVLTNDEVLKAMVSWQGQELCCLAITELGINPWPSAAYRSKVGG